MNNQPFHPPKRSFDLSQVKYLVDLSGKEAPRLIDTGNLKMSKFDAAHQGIEKYRTALRILADPIQHAAESVQEFGIAVIELPEEILRDYEGGEN